MFENVFLRFVSVSTLLTFGKFLVFMLLTFGKFHYSLPLFMDGFARTVFQYIQHSKIAKRDARAMPEIAEKMSESLFLNLLIKLLILTF